MDDAKVFLHEHKRFAELISQIARSFKIYPCLVEKYYWLMHITARYYPKIRGQQSQLDYT